MDRTADGESTIFPATDTTGGWGSGGVRRPLVALAPFYLAGLAAGREWPDWGADLWPAAVLLAGGLAIWIAARRRGPPLWPLALAVVLIGAAAAGSVYRLPAHPNHVTAWVNRSDAAFGGVVVDGPRVTHGRARLTVRVDEAVGAGRPPESVSGRVRLTVADPEVAVRPGDRVRFVAVLRPIQGFGNPGGFDYREYMAGRGIHVDAFVKSAALIQRVSGPGRDRWWGGRIAALRGRIEDRIATRLFQPAAGLIRSMVLGDRGDLWPEVEETFRRLGLAHLLAVSGLHMGLAAACGFYLALNLLGLKPELALRFNIRRAALLFSAAVVVGYAVLVGPRPSAVRAALMVLVFVLTVGLQRRADPLTALAAAAWAIMIADPAAAFRPSFQLSFAAVGTILLLAPRYGRPPWEKAHPGGRPGWTGRLGRRVWSLFFVTSAATLGTGPIIAYHFHQIPWPTLLSNFIFTPLFSGLVILPGLIGAATYWWPALSGFFLSLAGGTIDVLLPPMQGMAAWPGLDAPVVRPGPVFFAAYAMFWAGVLLVRPRRRAVVLIAAAVLLAGATAAVDSTVRALRPRLTVTILDVGHGLAAHLNWPDGCQMVIDGGGFPGSSFDPGRELIRPFLLSQGVRRLDVAVLSHPQTDHAGGLPYLIKHFRPNQFWTNNAAHRNPDARRIDHLVRSLDLDRLEPAQLSEPMQVGAGRVRALHPPPGESNPPGLPPPEKDLNAYSLVLSAEYGAGRFLFPGDLTPEGERLLVDRWGDRLAADVLVAPHHGGRGSLTPGFLAAVSPRYIVFSAGDPRRSPLPNHRTVARARRSGAQLLFTHRDGAVTFTADRRRVQVRTHR